VAELSDAAAAQLTAIHAAVTSKLALEIHPTRRDGRQFAALHFGPIPLDTYAFDTAWCTAACGRNWKVDIDPMTQTRARAARGPGWGQVTIRGAAPLPRRVSSTGASPPQLASYRVVIEAYPAPGKDTQWCVVGFVPSHTSTDGTPVTPVMGNSIHHYGGWWFTVCHAATAHFHAGEFGVLGWRPLLVAADGAAADADTSTYATTDVVPVVPAGSAVELAVDYAAGTCRVAFYTPAAVAGGFVDAPYAKMELRFAATPAEDVPNWGAVPARSVPSAAADSCTQLYPAVGTSWAGATWRFV
jgi:hypothetical protein